MTASTINGSAELASLRRIRWAVRAVLIIGVAASVVANILHAKPNAISQTIAAWPPLALLITIELVSRVPMHRLWLANVRRCGTTTIALIAAWVSYWHMAGVAGRYGETGAAPYLMPLSVDGLVVVASVSLVELAGRIRTASEPAPVVVEVPGEPPVEEVVEPVADQPVDTSDEASPSLPPSAVKIAKLRQRTPALKQEEVARKARVSVSTVKRHWAVTEPVVDEEPTDPTPTEMAPTNGRVPQLEGATS